MPFSSRVYQRCEWLGEENVSNRDDSLEKGLLCGLLEPKTLERTAAQEAGKASCRASLLLRTRTSSTIQEFFLPGLAVC
ncbi:Hypothetical protein NTJ_07009 [Nesidiocoris tenuis]|uniref:Uncharacterized protein n=1 Tax=Nesidiocoris tenuis TaxID=355587 RepID=A0ABN7ATE2_9HEMI|nr:Hypothetical protein NTJ_07009 [Nesidiocoris tenuis]